MASREDEKRWRNALKTLGAASVRRQLQQPAGDDAGTPETTGITTDRPHPPRQFVDAWYRAFQLRRQRAKDVRLYVLTVLVLVVVAAGVLFLTVR